MPPDCCYIVRRDHQDHRKVVELQPDYCCLVSSNHHNFVHKKNNFKTHDEAQIFTICTQELSSRPEIRPYARLWSLMFLMYFNFILIPKYLLWNETENPILGLRTLYNILIYILLISYQDLWQYLVKLCGKCQKVLTR